MNDIFLLGPIQSGSAFMIVSIQGTNTPYVLNSASTGTGTLYYWESDLSTLTQATGLPIFFSIGDAENVTITDSINKGGIGFDSNNNVTNVFEPGPINLSQTQFATWWPPDTFLSGATYSMLNSTGSTGFILTTPDPTAPTISANNILFLPAVWYFGCTSSGSNFSISSAISSVETWYCIVDPSYSICTDISPLPSGGWTNVQDCVNGINYVYCLTGQQCGNTNCNGPCPQPYYDCEPSSQIFVCKFNAEKYFSDTKWYETPAFIGIVIGFVVLSILLIIVVLVIIHKGKKKIESQ